ncbi:MAG: MTH938/NDUFAF3 family protein [Bacteroidota bacterium]|nr:MTH938/NDUFAF3 family protein [Bacteroidota bacterium]
MSNQKQPVINDTDFGSIIVDGESYDHDIIISLEGKVKKRKKKLSKSIYGSSHTISLPEIEYVYQEHAEGIIIGSGQYGVTRLSKEATEFISDKKCRVVLKSTPEALLEWNRSEGNWIGLFHITC